MWLLRDAAWLGRLAAIQNPRLWRSDVAIDSSHNITITESHAGRMGDWCMYVSYVFSLRGKPPPRQLNEMTTALRGTHRISWKGYYVGTQATPQPGKNCCQHLLD